MFEYIFCNYFPYDNFNIHYFFLIVIILINENCSNFAPEYHLTAGQSGQGAHILSGFFAQMISAMVRFWKKRQKCKKEQKQREWLN